MKRHNFFALIVAIGIAQFAGIIGSVFTMSEIPAWYATLARPELSPPSWVFGPVWTTLYTLMGIAAYIVWRHGTARPPVRLALILWGIQLLYNTAWSIIFFGLHAPGAAFVEILFLWVTIAATIYFFARVSRLAAWLLAPYLLWVSFAAYLNYGIMVLNY